MHGRIASSGTIACTGRGRISTAYSLIAAVLLLVLPAAMSAQTAQSDARWQPWLGCWQPATPSPMDERGRPATAEDAQAPIVCVAPAPGAVDIATISAGKVVSTERVVADGQRHPRAREGCSGWQSAEFSADDRRVYLRSQDSCSGVQRNATGMIAMSGTGEWLDVQGVTSEGRTGVRTVRYRDVGIPATVPAQIASALPGGARVAREARTASASPLTTADVVDASSKVDAAVVKAWLLARGQGFALNARELVKLADAGVPGGVTDAMVALSYPKTFAVVDPTAPDNLLQPGRNALGTAGGEYTSTRGRIVPAYIDPYDYSYGYSPFGFGYAPYGYLPYGYSGYGYPYGYGFRGGYGGGYGYYTSPVIVLRGGSQQPVEHGQAINGYGYSRGRGSSPSPVGSGARVGGQSGRGSSGAPRPAPSGGGRTAHPRP